MFWNKKTTKSEKTQKLEYNYTLQIYVKDRGLPYKFSWDMPEKYEGNDMWHTAINLAEFYSWYMSGDTAMYQFDYSDGSVILLREQITGVLVSRH